MNDKALVKAGADDDPFAEMDLGVIERVITMGDLSKLEPHDRFQLYLDVCKSLGLNPTTQPFAYIKLNGQLKLYARKECTEQLRFKYQISIELDEGRKQGDVWMQKAKAFMPNGRRDESIGAVSMGAAMRGDALANAIMKCETKAKRRATLSICGLGFVPDDSELSTMKGAEFVSMDVVHRDTKPEKAAPAAKQLESADLPAEVAADPLGYEKQLDGKTEDIGFGDVDSQPGTATAARAAAPPTEGPSFQEVVGEAPYDQQPPTETEDSLARQYVTAMKSAKSVAELTQILDKIMDLQFEPAELDIMKPVYKECKKALRARAK